MPQGTLKHGKYTVDIEPNGCSVYAIEENQKVFLCGGIGDPELAMTIVEGMILVEAKRFYVPEATRDVKIEAKEETKETVLQFLKKVGD